MLGLSGSRDRLRDLCRDFVTTTPRVRAQSGIRVHRHMTLAAAQGTCRHVDNDHDQGLGTPSPPMQQRACDMPKRHTHMMTPC